MKKISCTIFLLMLVGACAQPGKSLEKYFDFDALINDQITQLSKSSHLLEKSSDMDGVRSDSVYVPVAEGSCVKGWNAELEIFRTLEMINKPTYKSVYKIEDPLKDSRSNLKIRQLSSTGSPIPVIRFYYQNDLSRIRKIEAEMVEKNVLFSTIRKVSMEFEEEGGKPVLSQYSLSGVQKMFMSDTVRYSVKGLISEKE